MKKGTISHLPTGSPSGRVHCLRPRRPAPLQVPRLQAGLSPRKRPLKKHMSYKMSRVVYTETVELWVMTRRSAPVWVKSVSR